MMRDLADAKTRFARVYADLPLGLREEVIVVLDGVQKEPVTWCAAYIEVDQDTEKGREILQKLSELEII